MIHSEILCKDYRSKTGYLIAMGRYKNSVESELKDRMICYYDKGWDLYLGEPIQPQIRNLKIELKNIQKELQENK